MKAVVAAFNQENALVGAFSVITNLRMELFQALIIWSLPLPLCRYEILLIWSTQHFYESKERNCPGEIKYQMDMKTITTPRTTRPPLLQRAAGASPLQNIHVSAYFKCISNRKLSSNFYLSSDILTAWCEVESSVGCCVIVVWSWRVSWHCWLDTKLSFNSFLADCSWRLEMAGHGDSAIT